MSYETDYSTLFCVHFYSIAPIYSVAMEPALKEAIKIAGKKKGKLQGGAKAVIREALVEHFKKNKDYFN